MEPQRPLAFSVLHQPRDDALDGFVGGGVEDFEEGAEGNARSAVAIGHRFVVCVYFPSDCLSFVEEDAPQ